MSAVGYPVHALELYINKPFHPRWLTGRSLGLQNYRSQQTLQPTSPTSHRDTPSLVYDRSTYKFPTLPWYKRDIVLGRKHA